MTYEMGDDAHRRADHEATQATNSTISPAIIGFVVVAVVAALFFVKNSHTVELDFIVFDHTTTVRWLIIISLVLGVLLDRMASMMWRRRKKRKARAALRD